MVQGKERLFSLDLLRGLGMFYLVCGGALLPPLLERLGASPECSRFLLGHQRCGITLCDLMTPLFIFACGAAVPLALVRRMVNGRPGLGYWRHVCGRVALLWALGMLVHGDLATFDIRKIGFYTSALQSIAVGYLAAAIVLPVRSLAFKALVPVALVGAYGLAGRFCSWIQPSMMFPLVALAGCYTTQMLRSRRIGVRGGTACLAAAIGAMSLAAGWGLRFAGVKVVAQAFTVPFTLQAVGWLLIAFALLYALTDMWKLRRGLGLFVMFGQFSLTAYLCESVFREASMTASDRLFAGLERFFPEDWAPVVKAAGFCAVVTLALLVRMQSRRPAGAQAEGVEKNGEAERPTSPGSGRVKLSTPVSELLQGQQRVPPNVRVLRPKALERKTS